MRWCFCLDLPTSVPTTPVLLILLFGLFARHGWNLQPLTLVVLKNESHMSAIVKSVQLPRISCLQKLV